MAIIRLMDHQGEDLTTIMRILTVELSGVAASEEKRVRKLEGLRHMIAMAVVDGIEDYLRCYPRNSGHWSGNGMTRKFADRLLFIFALAQAVKDAEAEDRPPEWSFEDALQQAFIRLHKESNDDRDS